MITLIFKKFKSIAKTPLSTFLVGVEYVRQHGLGTAGEAVPGCGADAEADGERARILQFRQRGAEPGAVQETVVEGHDLAGQGGIAADASPGDVVAAHHDRVRRGEQRADVERSLATFED